MGTPETNNSMKGVAELVYYVIGSMDILVKLESSELHKTKPEKRCYSGLDDRLYELVLLYGLFRLVKR